MIRFVLFALILTFFAYPAVSGSPVSAQKTCPLDGEKFEIVETVSCSTMGRTMSFKPVTSCDFVTRLPVCPTTGLPLYKEFSEEELERLRPFVETEDYRTIRNLPPWQRAYRIAEYLQHTGSKRGFQILLMAFWHEHKSFLNNSDLAGKFVEEAEGEMDRDDQGKPFIAAILTYAFAASGEPEQADAWYARATSLTDALGTQNGNVDFLRSYLKRLGECRDMMTSAECLPDAGFRP